jgi:phosphomannomutase
MRYIDKYIESFDNREFKFQFAKTFLNGTGNKTVDGILSKYKNRIIPGVL